MAEMHRSLVATLITILCLSTAFANDGSKTEHHCQQEVRLDKTGNCMANMPIREQGTGNCYAMAAAFLVDAWGACHDAPIGYRNKSHRISPEWLSIAAEAGNRLPVSVALDFARKKGSCNQA